MEVVSAPLRKPATSLVQVADAADPWLRGFRCGVCSSVVAEPTMCCRACGSRTAPAPIRLAMQGKLFTWAVVHRSFPGVAVPFVSAIVDLDEGLTLKGTLRGVAPEALRSGLPVQVVFDDAGGATDADGVPYVGFHFAPLAGENV